LSRASGHPRVELCIPVSVFAEIVSLCLHGKENGEREGKFCIEDLHKLVSFWQGLDIVVLRPNKAVAVACYNLYMDESVRDSRLSPTDLVHLGYAMAYDLDYFITTDRTLRKYKVPSAFKLVVMHPKDVDEIFR
jgi:predicted nucleic acid-binding protein